MTMMSILTKCAALAALAVAAVAPAAAQEDRLRQQLSDATARIQTLQAENARLEGRIRTLEDSLNASEERARALEGSVNRAQTQARDLVAAVEERTDLAANAQQRIAQAQRQAVEARREAASARAELASLQTETQAMRQTFDRQNGLIEIAREKNEQLVSIGEEIITALEDQSFGARILAREPVTQLYRVRLENEIQAFRKDVTDQRFFPETEVIEEPAEAAEEAPGSEAAAGAQGR